MSNKCMFVYVFMKITSYVITGLFIYLVITVKNTLTSPKNLNGHGVMTHSESEAVIDAQVSHGQAYPKWS